MAAAAPLYSVAFAALKGNAAATASGPAVFALAALEIAAAPTLTGGPLTGQCAELFAARALVADRRAGDGLAADVDERTAATTATWRLPAPPGRRQSPS